MAPKLLELPPPNDENTGWPWAESSPVPSPTLHDGKPWPRVSIITPSYNQAQFLEETIRSVLLQNYPNLEYIIIDGGSTDGSVEIIKKYEPWLAYWVSEPDRGQSHAINKGFERATGEIIAWLNSDDVYMPGALVNVALQFFNHENCLMVYGDSYLVEGDQTKLQKGEPFDIETYLGRWYICQPASFQKRAILDKVGNLDEKLYYVMDQDWWLRLFITDEPIYFPYPLVRFRSWVGSKTYSPPTDKFFGEIIGVVNSFFSNLRSDDSRLAICDATPAKLYLQGSEVSLNRYEYKLAGEMIAKAGVISERTVNGWHSRLTDAIVYSLARRQDLTYPEAERSLEQIIEEWNKNTGVGEKQKLQRELRLKLGIMRKGMLNEKISLLTVFRNMLYLMVIDMHWLWQQRGWVGKAIFMKNA